MARAHYFHSYTFEFQEFITGHHVYKDVWTPFHGEKISCESQPDNFYDKYAVTVVKNTETVRHVAKAISPYITYILENGGDGSVFNPMGVNPRGGGVKNGVIGYK